MICQVDLPCTAEEYFAVCLTDDSQFMQKYCDFRKDSELKVMFCLYSSNAVRKFQLTYSLFTQLVNVAWVFILPRLIVEIYCFIYVGNNVKTFRPLTRDVCEKLCWQGCLLMEFTTILYDVADWKMGRHGTIWRFHSEGDLSFDMPESNVSSRHRRYCVATCGVFEWQESPGLLYWSPTCYCRYFGKLTILDYFLSDKLCLKHIPSHPSFWT